VSCADAAQYRLKNAATPACCAFRRTAQAGHPRQTAGPSFRLLVALLNRPGEVVTREELREQTVT
jgi:DNA-binding response OmpR family regulator